MFYGIDTSCYTTSLAVTDAQGRLLCDERKVLDVACGQRGLRQSDGVFQHLQNLPVLAEKLSSASGALRLQAVAASTRPRPVAGSYMPVFTVGSSFGRTLAATLGVPFIALSHQECHILAGQWSAGVNWDDFYALHVSGGTTEILWVESNGGLIIRELGGSADLHAGQFIDRVGVSLGLGFPAGPALEKLALQCVGNPLTVPVAVCDESISFSGPESHVQRAVSAGASSPAAVARGVEECVAQSLWRLIRNIFRKAGVRPVLFVGGVMANSYIRLFLAERLGEGAAFAAPQFAGDNAVGAALFAQIFA